MDSDQNPHKKKRKLEEGNKTQDIMIAAELGDTETCSTLLKQFGPSLTQTSDDILQTPLHLAVLYNHLAVVKLLLNNGSNINAQDINGDTPAHIAARNHHFSILESLLQDPDIDVDLANDKGISVEQLTTTGLEAEDIEDAIEEEDHKKKKFKYLNNRYRYGDDSDYEGLGQPPLPREEREWRQRLLNEIQLDIELDYRDDGLDSWCEEYGGWAEGETEESFARRIWREMKQKETRSTFIGKPPPSTSVYGILHSEAEEARKKAKKAAEEESAKILEEEQRKEKEWKQALLEGDVGTKRARYEAAWQFLIARLVAKQKASSLPLQQQPPLLILGFKDIPWIAPPLDLKQKDISTATINKKEVERVVMSGVYTEEEKKRRLRGELVRWHPDKFKARFDKCLKEEDREKILRYVDETARILTDILAGGSKDNG